jgi:hypothetical protein
MAMSVSLDFPFLIVDRTIRNGQSTDTDIDIHKKKTLEIGQSGMGNLETLTLPYDSVVFLVFLLDLRTVLTVWYFLFFY